MKMFVRKLMVGSAVIGSSGFALALIPVVQAEEKKNPDQGSPEKCRRSELPVYPLPVSTVTKVKPKEPSEVEKFLIGPISTARVSISDVLQQGKDLTNKTLETVTDTADNFGFIVSYLREEENEPQRLGAVGIGAATGFIFGLRGGFIKKIFYSLIGTGIMGSICFPEQTHYYGKEGVQQAKLLSNIIYNFIYGVKPGDPQHQIEFPEINIPKNYDEVVNMISGIGKSIKDAVLPPETKTDSKKE